LLITHDPALARRCDRIIHLADGRITEEEIVQSRAAK
jgi:putative ABC transport system ATP-binding protein